MELRRGANLPFPIPGHWACRWIYHWVCDAWPVRRATYGYLPSHRASPPNGRYQFILLGEQRHIVCEQFGKTLALSSSTPITTMPPRHTKLGIWILEIVWFVDWKVKGQGNGVTGSVTYLVIFSHNGVVCRWVCANLIHILFCNCGVVAMWCINFCVLALGSGQHLLYRLGSG